MKPLIALLLALLSLCANHTVNAQKKLSIVGSSTSACYGPTVADSCYVRRLKAYFNKQLPNDTSISNEFAAGGYTVYQGMPSSYVSPYSTPSLQPDAGHNITAALATHPDVILINYPTNGYDFLTISEILFCLRTIKNTANQAGVPCFVTTTQPRTSGAFNTPAVKAKMAVLKDSILEQFGNFAIDFYTGLINLADSSIRYDAGDGAHMNNTGHDSLFQRVLRKNIFGSSVVVSATPACVTNTEPANGATTSTATTATLSWNAEANATSYDVYIWTGTVPSLTPIANTTVTSFNAANLLAATSYSWFVIPKNQVGAGTNCGAAKTTSFTTAAAPVLIPACVTNISPGNGATTSTATTATLSWNAAANATSYDVYIWTGTVPSSTPIANTTITSFNAANLFASTSYSWFVVPKNQTGAASNCGAAKTTSFTTAAAPVLIPGCTSGIAPANGSTTSTATTAALSWNAAANANSYDVYIWTGSVPSSTPIANTTATSFTANNLLAATSYNWFVAPNNTAGTAGNCRAANTISFKTAALPIVFPVCVTNISPANGAFIASQTNALLTWNAAASATSYDVYIWTGAAPSLLPIVNTTSTSFAAANLFSSTVYSWFVVPKNQSGDAASCGAANKTSFTTAPVLSLLPGCVTNIAPANGSTTSAATTATLSWSAAGNAASYDLYIWTGPVPSLTPSAVTTATSYTATGLAAASLYNWYVVPTNANGTAITCGAINKSVFTTAITPLPACATNTAPANGSTLTTETTATLTWPVIHTATSYDVYIWTGTIAPNQPSTNVAGTTFNAAGLKAGTTYNWYITPKNAAGSATGCGTNNKTTFTTAPAAGTGLLGTYYNGVDLNGAPLLTRVDSVIDFSFSYLTVLSPAPGIVPQDHYSVRWTGQVVPLYTETYTFYTMADDGVRLWVNGLLLVDNWNDQAATESSDTITLAAGRHYDIMIEYYENTGVSVSKLFWSGPGTPKSIVPQSQLYPASFGARALSRLPGNANTFTPTVSAAVVPNPVKAGQPARVQISSDTHCTVQLNLVNSSGAVINTQKVNLLAGMNTTYINTFSLRGGLYFINIAGVIKSGSIRLLVQ